MISFVALSVLLVAGASASETEFSYDAQDEWPGICVTGNENRQSPINIVKEDVKKNSDLIDLQLIKWDEEMDGDFASNGENVQFNPDSPGVAQTVNHLGTYSVQQFHMHWGEETGEGSEHRINGGQAELEIHFVQTKDGETDTSARDFISVIAVLADVDEHAPLTGPWEQLDVAAIQSFRSSTPVNGFGFDSLLPSNLDYWFYEGSLTTPPCSEVVAWFVLQKRITVPRAFLDLLREVEEDEQGALLTFNFRDEQDLAGRIVYEKCPDDDDDDDECSDSDSD